MRLIIKFLVKPISLMAVLAMTAPSLIKAQRTIIKGQKRAPAGVTLVYCNKRDTLRDRIDFVKDARTLNGRTILTSRYLLSDVKGSYNFSLRSDFDFSVRVRRKSGSNGRWSEVRTGSSRASLKRPVGIRPYYYWNNLKLTQSGNARHHNEFGLIITPAVRNQVLIGSWYTYRCAVSSSTTTQQSTACKWGPQYGAFGIPTGRNTCTCGRKVVAKGRCGK